MTGIHGSVQDTHRAVGTGRIAAGEGQTVAAAAVRHTTTFYTAAPGTAG
jgi:hypothetical protein